MWKLASLLLPFLLFTQELEVRLATRSTLKTLYLAEAPNRKTLAFDLNNGGFVTVLEPQKECENALTKFDRSYWLRRHVSYCISLNETTATVYNIEKNSTKTYQYDNLHRLSDQIHKDLFGREGIARYRVLFTKRTKNEGKGLDYTSEVWIADSNGENAKQLTHDQSYSLCPTFLKNDQFLYVSEKSGQAKIYRSSISDPDPKLLIELAGNQTLPSITKGQIAFITDLAGRPDLFTQNIDSSFRMTGKANQLFSAPRATEASPTYSPDGKQVAFVSDKDGPPRIYLLSTSPRKNERPRLLTTRNRENTCPAWSPDGKYLAYSAKTDGVRQIWIYDFATSEEIPLTSGPENKENPAWAPDSFHLIYNTENDTPTLFLTHLNQATPTPLASGRFASWEPKSQM